jgi:hypothetical protein
MLNSVNHLNAEVDYRRERLSRRVLDTAEHFNVESADRTIRSPSVSRFGFLARLKTAQVSDGSGAATYRGRGSGQPSAAS